MKKLLFLPTLLFLLCYCSANKTVAAIEYDYSDVSNLTICWNDILSLSKDDYYVYIYSSTCSHCNEIKQEVISFALRNYGDLYFVSFNKDIPIINDRNEPLEKDSVGDLGIVGTPSMFRIIEHVVKENYVGKKEIVETLTNS
jgi:hypothetical protein